MLATDTQIFLPGETMLYCFAGGLPPHLRTAP